MILIKQTKTLATLFLVLLLGIQVFAQDTKTIQISDKKATVSNSERAAIENIVREYLLKNPAIIREAMQELQRREEKERRERASANLKRLSDSIYSDADSPTSGNESGDVTVVAFFDYNCGHCKQSLPMLDSLLEQDKKVRIVYKELPILSPTSELGARAALAAGLQGKYREFHKALVQVESIDNDSLKSISTKLSLDFAKLQKDMDSPEISHAIAKNHKLATDLGVEGTPYYIIGSQIIPGAVGLQTMIDFISAERSKTDKGTPAGNVAQ